MNGVIYTATNRTQPYIDKATRSAMSLNRYTSLSSTLFTDNPELQPDPAPFTEVRQAVRHDVPKSQYMLDRLRVLLETPYERTLALDADTLICQDISPVFDILAEFDFAMCHGHCRVVRHNKAVTTGRLPSSVVPYAFAPVQAGVILYNKTPAVLDFLQRVIDRYIEADYYDDQIAFREVLWKESGIRWAILPPEYNFYSPHALEMWNRNHWKEASPMIFHYTGARKQPGKVLSRYRRHFPVLR